MTFLQRIGLGRPRTRISAATKLPVRDADLSGEDASIVRAIEWAKKNHIPGGGVGINERLATQEVTGYLIGSLHAFGQKALACELAEWEASVQRPDGAFSAADNIPYTFDTAQVIRGFVAVLDDMPQLEDNLRRACDYVESQIAPDGQVLSPSYDTWRFEDGTILSEYGNLYVLPPLLLAGKKLSERKYIAAAERGTAYFRKEPDIVEFKPELGTLSHYFGYMMEALVDLGELELARNGLRQAGAIQQPDGAIPAYPGVKWVCAPGLAQLSIAWYKLGEPEHADKAMAYLKTLQNPSGGFYGSYGPGAKYFPKQEITWAVKFFLDAVHYRKVMASSSGVYQVAI